MLNAVQGVTVCLLLFLFRVFLNVFIDSFDVIIFSSFLGVKEVINKMARTYFQFCRERQECQKPNIIFFDDDVNEVIVDKVSNHRHFGEFLHANLGFSILLNDTST